MTLLTGFHAVEEKIKSGKGCIALLVAKTGPRGRKIVELAVKSGIRVSRTGSHELDCRAPENRGIALEVEDSQPPQFEGLAGYLQSLAPEESALVVILDEITDPHNYGAILRSCDQFAAGLVLCRSRRTAKHADIIAKTSAGASAWVPVVETPNLSRAVQELKDSGFWVYGADMEGSLLYETKLPSRLALVLGGEAGLSRLLKESCDGLIAIPTCGKIDSLNVSVAAGILLYEAFCRTRRFQ